MRKSMPLLWIEQAEARQVVELAALPSTGSEPHANVLPTRSRRSWFNRVRGPFWIFGRAREKRSPSSLRLDFDRMLVTILVTDIVDSTQRVAEMGDRAWRALLDRHDEATRKQINQFGGREVGYRGDGVVAIFDSPARAVRCAAAIIPLVAALGIALRCGIHVGEVHVGGKKISGIAVHIAARIMAKAGPNEIFLSKIVSDLVTGSGFVFEDRGICELRGLPTKIHLYAMPMVIGAPDTGIVELKSSARLSDLRGNLSQGVCSR